jgi:hypothetical protein
MAAQLVWYVSRYSTVVGNMSYPVHELLLTLSLYVSHALAPLELVAQLVEKVSAGGYLSEAYGL